MVPPCSTPVLASPLTVPKRAGRAAQHTEREGNILGFLFCAVVRVLWRVGLGRAV